MFYELPEILASSQETKSKEIVFFRNNAKVIRARMFLKRASGAEIEILLLRPGTDSLKWWCLAKPLKKISIGEKLFCANDMSTPVTELIEKSPTGEALFEFTQDPLILSEKIGVLPLPPYIARKPHDENEAQDSERYQTVYAKDPVAAAAPTAGLHFTPELISKLQAQGHRFVDLTLHVGLDTFRPIATENVEEHKIHTETYEVPAEAWEILKKKEVFRLAVGTTSLRTMEDFSRKSFPSENIHSASLFVYPPQTIISADALITNFHLPKSTLMCLVSAFLTPGSMDGIAWLKEIYAEALKEGYRFYSYGDAMVIL
jgi:S-adenosylmethionine:tRNA ribosyltransferase-isomerase